MQNTQIKYTPQQEQELAQLYQTGVSVKDIAERLGKSERSVIAKLARMGVYQSTKHSTVKRTKGDLVEEISAVLGLESGTLDSLAKAEKLALETLYNEILTLNCNSHHSGRSHYNYPNHHSGHSHYNYPNWANQQSPSP